MPFNLAKTICHDRLGVNYRTILVSFFWPTNLWDGKFAQFDYGAWKTKFDGNGREKPTRMISRLSRAKYPPLIHHDFDTIIFLFTQPAWTAPMRPQTRSLLCINFWFVLNIHIYNQSLHVLANGPPVFSSPYLQNFLPFIIPYCKNCTVFLSLFTQDAQPQEFVEFPQTIE